MSRKRLFGGIQQVGENSGGTLSHQYLKEAECYKDEWDYQLNLDLTIKTSCETLETYEESPIVIYYGLRLQDKLPESVMDKLSSIKDEYTSLLLASIDVFFPGR